MLKRVARRVKGWMFKPPPPPPKPLYYRVADGFRSFRSSLNRIRDFLLKDDEEKNDRKHEAALLKTLESPKTNEKLQLLGTENPAKSEKSSTEEGSKNPKPDSSMPPSAPASTTKGQVYLAKITAFAEHPLGQKFIIGIFGTIASFGYYLWKQDFYVKYRITSIAQNPDEVESLLYDEWKGLKTNVRIKVNNRETPLPQWNLFWLLRSIPKALFSLHPGDIPYAIEAWSKQSKAAITPIDFSPIIKKVLGISASQFVILDGQKGTGKSTSMLLLCWHEIRNGRAALFLQLCQDPEEKTEDFNYVKAIKKNPSLIRYAAQSFQKRRLPFTIVIDDLHKYLKAEDTKKNAEVIIGYLWQVTEFFGTKIVFPSSDYGLKQAILNLPMHHSARFQQVRMYAPAEKELTEMITSGIKGLGHEKVEGNSPADVARYCEVVGTLRELKMHYLTPEDNPCTSVSQVTQFVFDTNVEAIPSLLEKAMHRQMKRIKAGDMAEDYVPYRRSDIKPVLVTLCKNQYIDPVGPASHALCEALARSNIARPVCGLSRRYEFHSFQIEVAIRALLDLPATIKPEIEHENGEPESTGRGSRGTLTALKSRVKNFEVVKKDVEIALGKK